MAANAAGGAQPGPADPAEAAGTAQAAPSAGAASAADGAGAASASLAAPASPAPVPPAKATAQLVAGRRHSAGIYGTIITAAILASAGPGRGTLLLAVSIIVTLLVYWVAEQYADLLGEQLGAGRLPRWHDIKSALVASWPMVTASFIPLVVLMTTRAFGASQLAAANAALVAAVVLLMIYGWMAGRAARLRGKQQLLITAITAVLGLLMVALKDLVLLHLH
ncbi:MAG: hypothetical protein ACLQDY_01150 [Streptosporangiaceae bacterium]